MPEDANFENKLLYHWLTNLVGSSSMFSLNLLITVLAGIGFSFKIIQSPYVLLLFGVISPIIFTLCLYNFVRNSSGSILNEQIPKAFLSRTGNLMMMFFDVFLIIGFALLIYLGYLNYFIFRFLQTIFFPVMMLIFLRVLFISRMIEKHDGEENEGF